MATHRICEHEAGLRVESHRGLPVEVRAVPPDWVVSSAGVELGRVCLGDVAGLAAFLTRLMRRAGPRLATVALPGRADAVLHLRVVRDFLEARQPAALATLDPRVARVVAALEAVRAPPSRLAYAPALLAAPWVVEDVVRFPAAAIALGWIDDFVCAGRDDLDGRVRALCDWRSLFSPNCVSYRSLNRTLMQLPAGFPGDLLPSLARVRLPRPVTDPLELAAVCIVTELPDAFLTRLPDIVLHARGDELAVAVARVGATIGRRLSPRRTADLRVALRFISDYPGDCRGRLGGLVDRAIRWHRAGPDARVIIERIGETDTPTARPPVPLPTAPGIRFLATVGEVVAEGERMRHCIGAYAEHALAGRCFLFHVFYGGAHASVEVDRRGRVMQASGPANTTNAAVAWGRRLLAAWGRGLRPTPIARPPRRRRRAEAPDARQLWLFPQPA